jgi:hypothetical protein
MAKKKPTTAGKPGRGIRLTAALTKRIEQWSRANGDDSRAEALHQLLARSSPLKKRKVQRTMVCICSPERIATTREGHCCQSENVS